MVPYVDSTWGVAHFSVPNESPCMCAFVGDKKTVVGKGESVVSKCTCTFLRVTSTLVILLC